MKSEAVAWYTSPQLNIEAGATLATSSGAATEVWLPCDRIIRYPYALSSPYPRRLSRQAGCDVAYVESHQSLLSHPKTRRLARALDMPAVHVMGHLHALWHWALDYADDGDLTRFDALDIADGAAWDGDADRFVGALIDCGAGGGSGFLERTDDGRLVIHDWWDYAGKLVERRKANAERMREARAKHETDTKSTRAANVQDTCETRAGANVTKLNVTEQNEPKQSEARPTRARPREKPAADAAQTEPDLFMLFVEGCQDLNIEPSEITGDPRTKQLGAIRATLKSASPDDVLGCLRWLISDDWRRQRGVDFVTVKDSMSKWIMAGRPAAVAARASPNGNGAKASNVEQSLQAAARVREIVMGKAAG